MSELAPESVIHPNRMRRVMGRFATGVTIITAEAAGETRGMTANAFMSGSLEPPLLIVSVRKNARMHDHLMSAGRFAVNILASGQEDIARHFGGSPIGGLEPRIVSVGGIPTLSDACAVLTAHSAAMHDCGDHTLFIGHIQFVAADDRPPLVYHAGRYASLVAMRDVGAPILEFW